MKKVAQQPARRFLEKLVRWAGPVAGLALLLATGGCASSRPAPLLIEHQAMALPASTSEKALHLKLVTYNIWGLPGWMTGARPGRYLPIARELERLDPDIALLQEAWTAKARTSVPADGPWAIARAAGQHSFFQQSGLVTLSKWPILGGEFYPFSRCAFPDGFVNKGVLKVTVQVPGGQVLNVWNVHLQEGRWPSVRRSQIRELVARVRAAQDGQIADLVGGDFNCTPQSPSYRELVDALGPSVQQLGGAHPFVTFDGLSAKPGAGQTIDYIFLRPRIPCPTPQAAPCVVFTAPGLQQRLSDHLGIEAVVNLTPASSLTDVAGTQPESSPWWRMAVDDQAASGAGD
jgi:endonuclease/exonuclease/phosphatase family metal-dependent hydrolase